MMRTSSPSLTALRVKGKLLLAAGSLGCAGELCQDFIFPKDEVILVVHLDFGAAVLAEQHAVAHFNVERNALALLDFACASGNHFALLRLLFCRVRDDDAALD